MKVGELSREEKMFIKKIHSESSISWDDRMKILMKKFGKSERTIRRWISKLGFSEIHSEDSDQLKAAMSRKATSSRFYIISWAQNATPIHGSFFNNLLTYAAYLNAEVHVICGRYKNPTSVFSDKNHDWWDDALTPYLSLSRLDLHSGVSVLGDVKIQPTASNPLMGFEGITGSKSTIIGHPRVHLRTLPVLDGYPPKFLVSTGAVTLPNYTDSRSGKTAEFHHTYGFTIVEVKDGQTYFLRQVTADVDGSFCDLLKEVKHGEIHDLDGVEGFVLGDLHAGDMDEELYKATLSYLSILKPKQLVLHDVFDGKSISHHERKDPIKNYRKYITGRHSLRDELNRTMNVIAELLPYNPIVVRSNHDIWLDRWVVDQDWKKEIHNSLEYLEFASILLSGKAPKGLFPYLVEQHFGPSVKCLDINDSYRISSWEVANHGHLGANGSKGNIEQFRKFSTKVIVGDWHQANRRDGALSVGTHSKLRIGFNDGPSSWVNADVIIHKNEKAQHLIYFNNEFTTLLDGRYKNDT